MAKHFRRMTRKREKQLKAKYRDGSLTKSERNEWWSYRLKQMRDEYYGKKGKH